MPSTRFESPAPRMTETWLLLGMTCALSILLAGSAGIGLNVALAMAVALPLVALMLLRIARRIESHCLHSSVFMVAAGGLGLLLGARTDLGPLGLVALASWCSAFPSFGLFGAWSMIALAPWTCAGMLIGCNLGMALSAYCLRPAPRRRASLPHYLACNAGMLIGMVLAESSLSFSTSSLAGGSAAALMFWVMILGMTAGMWVGWLSTASLGRAPPSIAGTETPFRVPLMGGRRQAIGMARKSRSLPRAP